MTTPGADWDRLGRYLAGELSPAEAGEVRRWLAENAKDDAAFAALAAATTNLQASRVVDVEGALRRVKARIAVKESVAPWRQYAGWAAAAAVVLAIGLWTTRSAPNTVIVEREFATSVGARDSITLDDGSRVILGPASRIVVRGRNVDLTTGEAFFVVVHNDKVPFTVRTGETTITDLGTEFSVHSDHDSEVRVVVREGSVQMARNADSVVLERGDVGVAQAATVTAVRGGATEDDLAWTTGKLVFRNAPISELGADLRRWYGVELRVTDSSLLKRHFTGSFASESPSRVLEVIALALGARADRRGDTVYIRPVSPAR